MQGSVFESNYLMKTLQQLAQSEIIFEEPWKIEKPNSWIEHIPFAFYLVEQLKPAKVVELGVHSGNSYNAFCQAVKHLELNTRCYGIDHWKGDDHAGFYGDQIFKELKKYQDENYQDFSTLMRMSFDEAKENFEEGSIDLLHIDGLHTYESVRHDYENWKPKLSKRAVVLFHDTCVREHNFGVWKLWDELKRDNEHFEFFHGHGLGVLFSSADRAKKIVPSGSENIVLFRKIFELAGGEIFSEFALKDLNERINSVTRQNDLLKNENREVLYHLSRTENIFEEMKGYKNHLEKVVNSISWKVGRAITFPLRALHSVFSGSKKK